MKKHTLITCLLFCFSLAFSISSSALTVTATQTTSSSCSNGNTAVATATGGTTPYTYLWNDANSQTTAVATGLSVGTYTIMVADNLGATATAGITITIPPALNASAVQTSPPCGGSYIALATATGGAAPYIYLWSDPGNQTTAAATGLSNGTYTITIHDSYGCSATTSTVVGGFSISEMSVNNPACNGDIGTLTPQLTPSGAPIVTAFYYNSYIQKWQVPAGVSQITVTLAGAMGGGDDYTSFGGYGAYFTGICTVNPGHILSIVTGGMGQDNGYDGGGGGASWVYDSTLAGPNIGTPPLSALIAVAAGGGGASDEGFNGGPGGTNLVLNTPTYTGFTGPGGTGGNGGDSGTNSFSMYYFQNGSGGAGWISNGKTAAGSSGGGMDWTNNFKGAVLVSSDSGGYGGGGGGCNGYYGNQSGGGGGGYNGGGGGIGIYGDGSGGGGGSYLNGTVVGTPVATVANNGFVRIAYTLPAGVLPYTYSWSPGGGTNAVDSGAIGTYTVTVYDNTGCSATASATLTQPATLAASVVENNMGGCSGTDSATVSASGGTMPYNYLWSDANSQTTATANGLTSGSYTVTITDNHGCNVALGITITQPLLITAREVGPVCSGPYNAEAIAITGVAPYTYLWNDANSQTTATITGLSPGSYTVTVTDNHECSLTTSVTLTPYEASIVAETGVHCIGDSNGSLTVGISSNGTVITKRFTTEEAVQNWIVPPGVSQITVALAGAQGGAYLPSSGNGASFTGVCSVYPGHTLSIVSGEHTSYNGSGGGGGASWVYDSTVTGVHIGNPPLSALLAVAAGGGGEFDSPGNPGGIDLIYNTTTSDANTLAGGAGGNGGAICPSYINSGGGGAGWISNGGNSSSNKGGNDWTTNFTGGSGRSLGGYGGGGGGGNEGSGDYGGGGGGYNGGGGGSGGGYSGGGGGSYLNGTVVGTPVANQTGNGFVTIQYVVPVGAPPYTYSWAPGGQTSALATGLTAGSYTVTIQDNNGCISTASGTVTQPAVLTATASEANIGGCSGTDNAIAIVSGGTSPYKYVWNDAYSQTTATATGLTAGSYTVTITDYYGCIPATAAITITAPLLLRANTAGTNSSACNNTGGQASSSPTGGYPPYTYLWSGGSTNAVITGLSTGTYSVSVNDSHGCMVNGVSTVYQDSVVGINITSRTNPLCNGGTGSLTAIINVPAIPDTVKFPYDSAIQNWTVPAGVTQITVALAGAQGGGYGDGGDGASFTGICNVTSCHILSVIAGGHGSGNYGGGGGGGSWVYDSSITGLRPGIPPLSALLVVAGGGGGEGVIFYGSRAGFPAGVDLIGNTTTGNFEMGAGGTGGNGGSAGIDSLGSETFNGAGGAGWFSNGEKAWFGNGGNDWANGFLNSYGGFGDLGGFGGGGGGNLSGGGGGGYNGGGGSSYTYFDNGGGGGGSYLNGTAVGTPVANQTGNGYVNIIYMPPTASPYTYSWAPNGGTNLTATGLSAGAYTVTVTDASGCSRTASTTITQPPILLPNATIIQNSSGCNGNTGIVQSAPTGGTAPYTYQWNDANSQATATATGLSVGTYTVTVNDSNGCNATASVTITQSPALSTSITQTFPTCHGVNNASAMANVSGGSTPYTYAWSDANIQTNLTATGLSAGTYTVTATDNNGCSVTASVAITQPTALSVITGTNPSECAGTGVANANTSGGTNPYTYAWSDALSQNTATATHLDVGNYTVTVTDNNGCSITASASISQAPLLIVTATPERGASCNPTGIATATVTHGSSPYQYLWSTGSTSSQPQNLAAGSYTVTVTDKLGCTATASVTITQAPTVTVSAVANRGASCNPTGEATATGANGNTPYTYLWSNGNTAQLAQNLNATTYTVTVTDHFGCTATTSVTITQAPTVTVSAVANRGASCNPTGEATATGANGNTPYTYLWSNGNTAQLAQNLNATTYTVTVTDHFGCTATTSVTITQAPTVTVSAVANRGASCNPTGEATATGANGNTPYTYLWSNGNTAQLAQNLNATTYTVTVTDHFGCTATTSVTITQAPTVTVSAVANRGASCNPTGEATATGANGSTPYAYAWNPGGSTVQQPQYLSAGNYTVTVTDHLGCTASTSITITQAPLLSVTTTIGTCNGYGDATIISHPVNGNTPYTYSWSTSATTASITVPNNTYIITVTDHLGCTATASASVTCPPILAEEKPKAPQQLSGCCDVLNTINLYPNPSTGQFNLTGLQQGMTIEIYDYTGRMINTLTESNETMQFNLSNQANGIYLVRIISKEGTLVDQKKIVKGY